MKSSVRCRTEWLGVSIVVFTTFSVIACTSTVPVSKPPPAHVVDAKLAEANHEWCVADEKRNHGEANVLADLNEQFLDAHVRARKAECHRLESEAFVVRYSFGVVEARLRGKPLQPAKTSVLPAEYHALKDVSHAVFLAALLFAEPPGDQRDAHVATARARVDDATNQLAATVAKTLPPEVTSRQLSILLATHNALDAFSRGTLDEKAQTTFFSNVRPALIDNLRTISGGIVRNLDRLMTAYKAQVSDADWNSLVVVVGVMHQARAREIGIRYFEHLLNELVGEGARNERRLVIGEGLARGPEQYGLLSMHNVDRLGGTTVFNDASRLQWDVLGEDDGSLDKLFP